MSWDCQACPTKWLSSGTSLVPVDGATEYPPLQFFFPFPAHTKSGKLYLLVIQIIYPSMSPLQGPNEKEFRSSWIDVFLPLHCWNLHLMPRGTVLFSIIWSMPRNISITPVWGKKSSRGWLILWSFFFEGKFVLPSSYHPGGLTEWLSES